MCTGLNGYVLVYFIQAIFRSAIQICKNKLLLYISCACTMLRFGLIHVYGMYTYIYIYIYIYICLYKLCDSKSAKSAKSFCQLYI